VSPISSVIANIIIRVNQTESHYPWIKDLLRTIKSCLEYHTQVLYVDTFLSRDALVCYNNVEMIKEDQKHQAILNMAEEIINSGFYETIQEVDEGGMKTRYKIHILIDRGIK
jgi:hypothetical protein